MVLNILLIAYKIEADKGSEDGTGYHLAHALVQRNKNVKLITRTNNVEKLRSDPNFSDVAIIGVDVPRRIGFFKNKEKGIILYYYLWQICVGLKVRSLQKTQKFDIIHQLNFHATWSAHFLFSKDAKIIWGPLTHHALVPKALWFGKGYAAEIVKNIAKYVFWYWDPFLVWAAVRSHKILYSAQTLRWPYSLVKDKLVRMTYAASVFPASETRTMPKKFNILFVGRLTNLKGCVTALLAVQEFCRHLSAEQRSKVTVTMIGEGPLQKRVTTLARMMTDIDVDIVPWLPQSDLVRYYQNAAVFLYPSFEGQGLVVAEALANGCPIICFEKTGPHDVAADTAVTVKKNGLRAVVIKRLSAGLAMLFNEFEATPDRYKARIEASFARARQLEWHKTAETITEIYHAAV